MPSYFFVLLVETRFHHVGWAGLKLLDSSGPPASPSQSAETTLLPVGSVSFCLFETGSCSGVQWQGHSSLQP